MGKKNMTGIWRRKKPAHKERILEEKRNKIEKMKLKIKELETKLASCATKHKQKSISKKTTGKR